MKCRREGWCHKTVAISVTQFRRELLQNRTRCLPLAIQVRCIRIYIKKNKTFRICTFKAFHSNQRWTFLRFFFFEIILSYLSINVHACSKYYYCAQNNLRNTHGVYIALTFNNCFWLWPLTLTLVLVGARLPCTEVFSQSRLSVIFFSF